MSSVKENRAGVASGINNAVSRTAGLLAVAVFGLVMLQGFNSHLNDRLQAFALAPEVKQELDNQRVRLADVELPASLDAATKTKLQNAINESFVAVSVASIGLGALGHLERHQRLVVGLREEVDLRKN